MKIAIIHDFLTQLGGAEKVLQSFQNIFTDSPVFVLVNDHHKTQYIFSPAKINTSWLQHFPLAVKNYQWYLTLMPSATEAHKLDNYDVIISSASSIAKGVKKKPNSLHICYCHTPTRYLWHDAHAYVEDLGYNRLIKSIIPFFLGRLRNWDFMAAQRVDYFIANSKLVSDRIRKYYGRDSKIIYPPVETNKFYISSRIGNYFLIGGRLVAYKRYDLAVRAFNKLGIKLKIFGDGPDKKRLVKMARSNIEFLGNVSDTVKANLYSKTIAFIHPQIEDFGITAVEAMASGRPVIAYHGGGALETVINGVTGEFFDEQTWQSLIYQIINFNHTKFNPHIIKAHAHKFHTSRFEAEVKTYIEQLIKDFGINRVFKIS